MAERLDLKEFVILWFINVIQVSPRFIDIFPQACVYIYVCGYIYVLMHTTYMYMHICIHTYIIFIEIIHISIYLKYTTQCLQYICRAVLSSLQSNFRIFSSPQEILQPKQSHPTTPSPIFHLYKFAYSGYFIQMGSYSMWPFVTYFFY